MKTCKKFSLMLMLVASFFMTGCDAQQIINTITQIAQGIQQAAPAISDAINTVRGIFGNDNNNNNQAAPAAPTPTPAQPTETAADNPAEVVVPTATDEEEIVISPEENNAAAPAAAPAQQQQPAAASGNTQAAVSAPAQQSAAPAVSERGQQQMKNVVDYALANHKGASRGQCFNAVWGYLTASGYGNLGKWNDLPSMQSGEARHFAEFMNARQANLDEAGLRRLDTTLTPPITSPHDPRIPRGAVIVVGPNSTGTAHATAGDIVIKAGEGRFVNDGPNMDYGTADSWKGTLLGVYIPK